MMSKRHTPLDGRRMRVPLAGSVADFLFSRLGRLAILAPVTAAKAKRPAFGTTPLTQLVSASVSSHLYLSPSCLVGE